MAEKDLVINEWNKGIAQSPLLGFANMVGIDTESYPGFAEINFKPVNMASGLIANTPNWFVRNPLTGNIYCLDASGILYTSSDLGNTWAIIGGNTRTGARGNGLAVWKDYIFVTRDNRLDKFGPLSSSPSWTNDFTSYQDSETFNPICIGQDDRLYWAAGNKVYALSDVSTSVGEVLDLPSGYVISSLCEFGYNLAIGANIPYSSTANIYMWDRISSTFEYPIILNEEKIHQLLTVSNNLYVVAGDSANLYISNGSDVQLVYSFPTYITGIYGSEELTLQPGAIMQFRGKIYTGIGGVYGDQNGVYSIGKDGVICEHIISTGTKAGVTIGAVYPISVDKYLIGWKDGSSYGIDLLTTSSTYSDYTAFIESALFRVGTRVSPKAFSKIEVILSDELASGHGIRIKYRKNLTDSFTTLATFDYATYGAKNTFTRPFGISCSDLQIRIEMTSSDTTSPRLNEIRIS